MGLGCTATLLLLLLLSAFLLPPVLLQGQLEEDPQLRVEDSDLGKAILEMLHINTLSMPRRTKPHPYMKQVYLLLRPQEAQERASPDGTLVQSFRSITGWKHGSPGWIWFNVSHLKQSVVQAELVLLRKTLHPEPLSVGVAVHSVSLHGGNLTVSKPLDEKLLSLDRLPPSGYDVFDVTAALAPMPARGAEGGPVGFQLRYSDESGSLVLHDALTQSLYCLHASSPSEPLLVAYQAGPGRRQASTAHGPERRQRQHCSSGCKRHLPSQPLAHRPTQWCQLHYRYVDFHTGRLSNWILEPMGFNSSFCRGTCNYVNTTESASEDRNNGSHSGNSPGCFPQEMSPLTVMYKSDKGDIVIKTLRNMRAESCVCQPNDPQ